METAFPELMPSTLVPKVTFLQELIVPTLSATLSDMDNDHEKTAFASRFNEICDDMQVPPKGKARQSKCAGIFGVTQKGARKWLEGEGYPNIDTLRKMAVWADVNFEWLVSGRGPKRIGDHLAAEPRPAYNIKASIEKGAASLADEAHQIASAWLRLDERHRARIKADLLGAEPNQAPSLLFDADAIRNAVSSTWAAIPKTLEGAPMLHDGETFTEFVMRHLAPPADTQPEEPKVSDDEKRDPE